MLAWIKQMGVSFNGQGQDKRALQKNDRDSFLPLQYLFLGQMNLSIYRLVCEWPKSLQQQLIMIFWICLDFFRLLLIEFH